MSDDIMIVRQMRDRQLTLARIAAKNGWSLKAISLASKIPYSTVRSYFPGEKDAVPHIMPITALVQLFGVLPDEWLSILIEGKCLSDANHEAADPLAALTAARDALDAEIGKLRGSAA